MNSNNGMPFKKRTNPLESPQAPQPVQNPAPAPKVNDGSRLKYTATMDKALHRRLKVAAAMTGIQISTYIEEAVEARLNKEGR